MSARSRRSPLRTLLALALMGLATACVRNAPPAPVVQPGPAEPPPVAAAPPAPEAPLQPGPVVVQQGETLYAISRRSGVPVRSLIEANNLQPPYRLRAGQTLTVPQLRLHQVAAGETLYAVSRRYGVDVSTLARTNSVAAPYTIKVGQVLKLPAPVETVAAGAPPMPPQPPPRPTGPGAAPSERAPAERTLAERAPPVEPAPPAVAAVEPAAGPLPPAIPPRRAEPVDPPGPAAAPIAEPPGRAGRGFAWPVRGRVLAGFGASASGTHNDGINIAAPRGTPVLAAENGVVAYAGNELRGFGNLVLLKHADGWVTAYAHNEAILVKRGDQVRRGQPIARVGNTGTTGEPQLHFEIRRGTRALDPTDHMPRVTAAAG